MSEPTLTLPEDIVCLMGCTNLCARPGQPLMLTTYAFTLGQVMDLDQMCGMRANWIVWLAAELPPEPFYSNQLKPFLFSTSIEEALIIRRTGKRTKTPVIYHAPKTRIL